MWVYGALRHRDFRVMWAGQLVSVTGSQMQLVTINWHVYTLVRPRGETEAALALGLVGLVRVVPIILCSLAGGVVADAFDRSASSSPRSSSCSCRRRSCAW